MTTGPPRKPSRMRPRDNKRRELAEWDYSQVMGGPITRGRSRRAGIPIPTADPAWHPIVQSWFRSLKLSGQSEFYEASDWATAVLAAKTYDVFLRTYNASILSHFVRLSERLGVTIVDRARSRIELGDDADVTDVDQEAADATVLDWQRKFDERNRKD